MPTLHGGGRRYSQIIAAILSLAPLAHANITSRSASFNVSFVNSINADPLLPGFNPALGTLDSVELILTFNMSSSTNALNQTFMFDPLTGPIFTPAEVDANAVATVMLNAGGLPVFNAAPTASNTTILAPLQDAQISTIITDTGTPSVPQPFVNAFVTTGFAHVNFALMQNVTINAFGIGSTGGQVILGPTTSDFSGTIEALYDYTPEIGTPEPSSAYVVLGCMAILVVIRWMPRLKKRSRVV